MSERLSQLVSNNINYSRKKVSLIDVVTKLCVG